tara:strand:+ start:116 stop:385 length:270 start_codon:yes stop_codon:yes gene_type:complete
MAHKNKHEEWDGIVRMEKTVCLSMEEQLHLIQLIATCTKVMALCTDKIDEKNYLSYSEIIKEAGNAHDLSAGMKPLLDKIRDNLTYMEK